MIWGGGYMGAGVWGHSDRAGSLLITNPSFPAMWWNWRSLCLSALFIPLLCEARLLVNSPSESKAPSHQGALTWFSTLWVHHLVEVWSFSSLLPPNRNYMFFNILSCSKGSLINFGVQARWGILQFSFQAKCWDFSEPLSFTCSKCSASATTKIENYSTYRPKFKTIRLNILKQWNSCRGKIKKLHIFWCHCSVKYWSIWVFFLTKCWVLAFFSDCPGSRSCL